MFDDEEMADNVETSEGVETSDQTTSPVVDNGAKAYSERLKKDREKIRLEERENLAKSFGYDSWDAYIDASTNNKLLDSGLDPESVRPVLKDLLKNDPEYIEAMKYKAEKEELEKQIFVNTSLQELNKKFGTNFKDVDELDAETVKLWNSGVPLDKAYAANNYASIADNAVKNAAKNIDSGKSHLTNTTGSTQQSSSKEYTKEELAVFGAFGISSDKAIAWKKSHENK